jgi:hypothetical protein
MFNIAAGIVLAVVALAVLFGVLVAIGAVIEKILDLIHVNTWKRFVAGLRKNPYA